MTQILLLYISVCWVICVLTLFGASCTKKRGKWKQLSGVIWMLTIRAKHYNIWTILSYLELSWAILRYIELSWDILRYLEISWDILSYLELSRAISSYLELSQAISSYLELNEKMANRSQRAVLSYLEHH